MNKSDVKLCAELINVDLEISSSDDLQPLVDELGKKLLRLNPNPQHTQVPGGIHFASFEASLLECQADETFKKFILG